MEPPGKKKYQCKYPGCQSWYYNKIKGDFVNKHFFRFPSTNSVRQLWFSACNVDPAVNVKCYVICEDHFESNDFMNELNNKLKCFAVPKSFLSSETVIQLKANK